MNTEIICYPDNAIYGMINPAISYKYNIILYTNGNTVGFGNNKNILLALKLNKTKYISFITIYE